MKSVATEFLAEWAEADPCQGEKRLDSGYHPAFCNHNRHVAHAHCLNHVEKSCARLFVAQAFDEVEVGCVNCRHHTADDAHQTEKICTRRRMQSETELSTLLSCDLGV